MNTENTKAQMRKGILEFCILSLINNKEMYVSDLIDELKKGKLDVVEGTLYPLLTRLKNGEFLAYRWEESTSGPPRKYYQITEKGKTFLAELQNTWNELKEIFGDSHKPLNIYIISDDEIKVGDWYINTFVSERVQKPQIHTVKTQLINHKKEKLGYSFFDFLLSSRLSVPFSLMVNLTSLYG